MPPSPAKRALRARARSARAALSEAERARASAAIAAHVTTLPAWKSARCVALFASMGDEVDTGALIAAARAEGRRVALPVVVGRSPLQFRDATDPACPMARSAFGVPEPTTAAPVVPLDAIDLFVIPALAFDRGGRRLGYGAGFYDRTLAGRSAPKVLVAFAAQEVPEVPVEPHDVPADLVVTEHGPR